MIMLINKNWVLKNFKEAFNLLIQNHFFNVRLDHGDMKI